MMSEPAIARFEETYARHRRTLIIQAGLGWSIFLAVLAAAIWVSEFSPGRLADGALRLGDFIAQMLPALESDRLLADARAPGSIAYWYYAFPKWARLLSQSIEIAVLATVLGFCAAFALSFPAARRLGTAPVVTWIVRRFLELARTVPELVSALIFVFAFGVGPLAGVLAITIHTMGALGKLFSEVHENAGGGPIEGVAASGGGWLSRMRFGVLPQTLPNLASYALLRFEINVAASSAIGVVGAGGIGMELRTAIDLQAYQDALAIILMVVGLIFLIDLASERLRILIAPATAR
jgi:phosphonate transport system permease protein